MPELNSGESNETSAARSSQCGQPVADTSALNKLRASFKNRPSLSTQTEKALEAFKNMLPHASRDARQARNEQADSRTDAGKAILCLAGLTLFIFVLAGVGVLFEDAKPAAAVMLIFSAIGGLYVMCWQVEDALVIFQPFGSTKIFLAAFVGLAIYFAHGFAADEVNTIFGVDAVSLPHTTAAATVFKLALPLEWIFAVTAAISFLGIMYFGMIVDNAGMTLRSCSALISSLVIAMIIHLSLSDGSPNGFRQKLLYQLALQTDFYSEFNCPEAKVGTDSVLFIGPSQTLALVAKGGKAVNQLSIPVTRNFEIPKKFQLVECNRPSGYKPLDPSGASPAAPSDTSQSDVLPTKVPITISATKNKPNANISSVEKDIIPPRL